VSIPEITIHDLASLHNPVLFDVREVDEYTSGHVPGAVNVPLSQVQERTQEFQQGDTVYVICQAGGRSMRACEYLSQQPELASTTFINVQGGTGAWIIEGHKVIPGDSPS
jgi:rhodanese-related sulfurtransferase